jgi:hypothetical protein
MFRKRYEAEVFEDSPVDAFYAEERFRFRWLAGFWARYTILTKCKAIRSRYLIYHRGKLIERGHFEFDWGGGEWVIIREK